MKVKWNGVMNRVPALLTMQQAAQVLGLSKTAIYSLAKNKNLPLFGTKRMLVVSAKLGEIIGREITIEDFKKPLTF